MALDLGRMLERCRKGQWSVDDFDWNTKPAPMSKFDEMEICQAFTNLIYIERIAALAFLEFSKTGELESERAIFETFYDDEIRHAEAMFRLSNYFNQNNYKIYTPDPALVQFVRTITTTIKDINPEFASAMVTLGELVLDVALLRAVNDYVEDPLSRAVIEKVNQDESRHIAMDFYLTEKYGAREQRRASARELLTLLGDRNLFGAMAWALIALGTLFGRVAGIMDPGGKRFQEAASRFALLGKRNKAIARNRNYQVILSLSNVVAAGGLELSRVMELLNLGLFREIRKAEAAGEKWKRSTEDLAPGAQGHDVIKTAVDMLEEAD